MFWRLRSRPVLVASLVALSGCGAHGTTTRTATRTDEVVRFCNENAGACDDPVATGATPAPQRSRPASLPLGPSRDRDGFKSGSACPRVLTPGSRAAEGALTALRRAVPHTWRIVNMSGAVSLTPAHYDIEEIASLGSDDLDYKGFSSRFARAVIRLCGRDVAGATWIAIVHFSDAAVIDNSEGIAFLARTRAGWRLWYRYR